MLNFQTVEKNSFAIYLALVKSPLVKLLACEQSPEIIFMQDWQNNGWNYTGVHCFVRGEWE